MQIEFNVKGDNDNDRDSFFIGSTVSLTNKAKFKVQFSKSLGSGIDRDATLFALGYDYQLNSNTLLYFEFDSNTFYYFLTKVVFSRLVPFPNALDISPPCPLTANNGS